MLRNEHLMSPKRKLAEVSHISKPDVHVSQNPAATHRKPRDDCCPQASPPPQSLAQQTRSVKNMIQLKLTVPSRDFLVTFPGWWDWRSLIERTTVVREWRLIAHPTGAVVAFRLPSSAGFTEVAVYPSVDAVIDWLLPTYFENPAYWQAPRGESEAAWRWMAEIQRREEWAALWALDETITGRRHIWADGYVTINELLSPDGLDEGRRPRSRRWTYLSGGRNQGDQAFKRRSAPMRPRHNEHVPDSILLQLVATPHEDHRVQHARAKGGICGRSSIPPRRPCLLLHTHRGNRVQMRPLWRRTRPSSWAVQPPGYASGPMRLHSSKVRFTIRQRIGAPRGRVLSKTALKETISDTRRP